MYDTLLTFGLWGPSALIAIGIVVLICGGEVLVRGAARLAIALRISPLIVGLTIVAACTSAPELAVSAMAAFRGNGDIAVGNVVGSNICNICLILGISAVLSPIAVSATLIRREIPLMILLAGVSYYFALTGGSGYFPSLFNGEYVGSIARWEGIVFLLGLVGYMAWTVREVRKNRDKNTELIKEVEEGVDVCGSVEKSVGIGNAITNICLIVIGVGLLIIGSDMLVKGGVRAARIFDISELIIGLTVLAVGTSLPELVVSVLAALKGKSDIAVGNVIGSNIFNTTGVLGVAAAISPNGLKVAPKALQLDFPVMILMSVFCIVICITGRRVSRGEGIFLLTCYGVYLAFLCV